MNQKLNDLLEIGDSLEQPLNVDWLDSSKIAVTVKRDDLLHPIISGNKWRKLKFALLELLASSETIENAEIISFGGGFSNHIHALAYCCHQLNKSTRNISLTAIIRGDYSANPTPMLNDIVNWGAKIEYVDRATYKKRNDVTYVESLKSQYQSHPDDKIIVIPEGGSQHTALAGFSELIDELQSKYDYILCPVASGGTMAGLITATHESPIKLVGIAVLKGQDYLEQLVTELLPAKYVTNNWVIKHDFHFGGYAKKNTELAEFCDKFYAQSAIAVEPVYSGKLFFALKHLITHNYFPINSRILVIHTGGLQGARGNTVNEEI